MAYGSDPFFLRKSYSFQFVALLQYRPHLIRR